MASLTDVDWDEELKRQAAVSALLAPPEEKPQAFDSSADETFTNPATGDIQPIIQSENKSDWHKLADQVFPNISPPPPEPVDIKTDEDTGTRYVQDPLEGKIPHAELATAADKEAFKPSDVTLPQIDVTDQGAPVQVRRGEELTEPWHPAGQDLRIPTPTPESPSGPVPKPVPGFVQSSQNAIVNPAAGVTPPTPVAPTITEDQPAGPPTSTNVIDPRIPTPTGVIPLPNAPITPPAATQLPNAPTTPPDPSRLQVAQPVVGGQGFFGGDLTQGPPGTKPDGTEDEPYWPKSNKDVALLPPGANYIDPKDQSQKVTPGAPAPALAAAPAATPTPTDQTVIQPTKDEWDKLSDSFWPSATSKTKPTVSGGVTSTTQVDGTPFPDKVMAVDGSEPTAFIVHHTGGSEKDANGVLDELNQRHLGVEFVAERDGRIVQIGGPGSQNIKTGWGKGAGLNNSNIVGIEVIARDDKDVTPAQIQAVKNFHAAVYGNVPVYGHGEVNPGHKEADEGMTIVNAIRAGGDNTGEPGTTPIETLVKLDQSGINVTHFGYEKPGEEGWDADSANGNGKYVKDLVPGYDVALNSAGAALVGNPKPGETFTFAGKEWRYGDAVSEKLKDPRFDIFDPTGNALSGNVQLGRAGTAEPKEQSLDDLAKDWVKLSPEEQAAADKQGQDFRTQQTSVLDKLNQSTPNPKQFWDKLQQPIEGVTDSQRQAYADNFKQEVTKYAQDFYGEKDPEKAFSRAVSDPGLEAYVSNIGRGLAGAVGQADIGIALAGKSIDRNRVDGFMNLVHPDSTGEGRAGFVKALTDIQDTRHRHDVFNEIYGSLPQNTKDAIGDPASILDSIDNLANPARQADLNKAIATKKAWVDQQLAGDPQLRGTGADWWTTGTGENLFNTVAALVPGGVGAVVRTSTLGAQMYSANMDRIAKEHPDYSPEQVSEEASKSAFMTLAPQEAVLALSHGITAPLLKWAGSLAEKPIVRFGIGGGVQVGAAAVGGAAGQVGENIAENKPIGTNVPQATGAAVLQSLPFAVHGGIGALGHEPVVKAPETPLGEHGPPIESVPIDTGKEHGPVAPEAGPVYGPRDVTLAGEEHGPAKPLTPVRGADILGPEDIAPPQGERWYDPGPITTRPVERTAFSPQELQQAVSKLSDAGMSPDQIHQILSQLKPGYEEGTQSVRFNPETQNLRGPQEPPIPVRLPGGEAQRFAPQWTAQPEPLRPAVSPHYIEPLSVQIARERAATSLGGTPRVVGVDARGNTRTVQQGRSSARVTVREMLNAGGDSAIKAQQALNAGHGLDDPMPKPGEPAPGPTPPIRVSESEPFVSKVANRYTAERMASGELGHIDPSQGKSTEELIRQGIQMSPEQRERLINNLVKGTGGDLDTQGAAIRSKEAMLSVQSADAARASEANPTNPQLKAEADAALKAVTDFHNGPVKKFKRVWSDAGRGLQREVPLDYSTLNGMKEAYLKGMGNGKEAPPEMEPKLKQTAARVKKAAGDEQTAINNFGKDIEKATRGKTLVNDDNVRAHLMEIMKDLPCRN